MNDNELLRCYKVVAVGTGAADLIEKVKAFGYEGVDCVVADSAADCVPTDDDRMVIIAACDHVDVANEIGRQYFDADVLTIGLNAAFDPVCFDSLMAASATSDLAGAIKTLLDPFFKRSYIVYDFRDFYTQLHDSRFFRVMIAEGEDFPEVVSSMQKQIAQVDADDIDNLAVHIYYNVKRQPGVRMDEVGHLSDILSKLPESIETVWSISADDTLPADVIRLTVVASGKNLR